MKNKFSKIAIVALFFLPMRLLAQGGEFTIKGKLGNLNAPAKIYLSYRSAEGKDFKDSCTLANGLFELKGKVTNPINSAQLRVKRNSRDFNNGIMMWIEPGNTIINGTDSLPTAIITGSKLNMDEQKLDASLKPFNEKAYALMRTVGLTLARDKTTPEHKVYTVKMEEITKAKIEVYHNFILSNPNSLVSIMSLTAYGSMKYGNQRGLLDVGPLFNSLSQEVQNSKLGKEYNGKLEKWKAVGLGTHAPDFTLYDQERKPVKLSDFKGKYVLVDFWASWCHPCREENRNLVEQYRLFKDKNFTILSVSIDEEKNWNSWRKAILQDHLTWPQVVGKVQDNEAHLKFGVQSIPDNFLISPDGYIIDKGLRGEALNKKLTDVLAEKK